MLFIVFRAADAIFAVVVAILISSRFGESAVGQILTVCITAGVVAAFEWLLIWAPRHSRRARQLLDPRALFADVWIQEVVCVYGREGRKAEYANRFGIFTVAYVESTDTYTVEGTAYTGSADEHARWNSTDVVHFAKDGRSMTYEFTGAITNPAIGPEDPRRTGFAHLSLASDDGGRGRVDHVAVEEILEFNCTRVTKDWLDGRHLSQFTTEALYNPSHRNQFAKAFAASALDQPARAR